MVIVADMSNRTGLERNTEDVLFGNDTSPVAFADILSPLTHCSSVVKNHVMFLDSSFRRENQIFSVISYSRSHWQNKVLYTAKIPQKSCFHHL